MSNNIEYLHNRKGGETGTLPAPDVRPLETSGERLLCFGTNREGKGLLEPERATAPLRSGKRNIKRLLACLQ